MLLEKASLNDMSNIIKSIVPSNVLFITKFNIYVLGSIASCFHLDMQKGNFAKGSSGLRKIQQLAKYRLSNQYCDCLVLCVYSS